MMGVEQLGESAGTMKRVVMVIDDSLTIRKILDICLRRAGYQVQCFADGVEAFRWLSSPEAMIPGLVLVDLNLPKMDGYEIIRLIKANPAFAQTICIILSQRDGVLDKLKGRLAGAHAYLTKPFRTQALMEVVQMHLGSTHGCETTNLLPLDRLAVPIQSTGGEQRAERGTKP
jgi:twitching motility two-component system response regulator PilG